MALAWRSHSESLAMGANIAVAAKTTEPDPRLPGTIHTAVEQINAAGGHGLACLCDVRFEDQIHSAVQRTVETFGGIDILINNASAVSGGNARHTRETI